MAIIASTPNKENTPQQLETTFRAAHPGGACFFCVSQFYNSQFCFDFYRRFWDNTLVVWRGFAAPDDLTT